MLLVQWMVLTWAVAQVLKIRMQHMIGEVSSLECSCSLHHRKFCFFYVTDRHEGSAADAHIYESAHVSDLCVPASKYYFADAGFGSCDALLVPYHGVRYHLKEWGCADVQ